MDTAPLPIPPMSPSEIPARAGLLSRVRRWIVGPPRDLGDRQIYHRLSLVALLAWVGLGADGLSSSAYGPEEAFRALGEHRYLAVPLAAVMTGTVFLLSVCYIRIIERFPSGGGGYVVASALLGERAGVVSGAALIIDYVLTIAVSIAAAGDALFSFLPASWLPVKLVVEVGLILGLTAINLRGAKESVLTLLPIFVVFLVTHALLIVGGVISQIGTLGDRAVAVHQDFRSGCSSLGLGGMLLLFLHAYSLGGGTYTGIEAVSNGVPMMREPKVETAKSAMILMAASLAFTASGLTACYLLWDLTLVPGKTLNAVLFERVAEQLSLGFWFVVVSLISEGALLVAAAQAGFLDGPRVLASMAGDSWFPRRFAALSDRLTTRNGIVLMGGAALVALVWTAGSIGHLVVMYSINVFVTFSLSILGMARDAARPAPEGATGRRGSVALFGFGFASCAAILAVTTVEKFGEGGWITLLVTGSLVATCFAVRRHYRFVGERLAQLYHGTPELAQVPPDRRRAVDPSQPTAVILVGGYGGLGIHTARAALNAFPGRFHNAVFLSAGVVDTGAFKGREALEALRDRTLQGLEKFIDLAEAEGVAGAYRWAVGTDPVEELERLCTEVAESFPGATFFAGQLAFVRERWYHPILHNGTAFDLQRRLQQAGRTLVILPVRTE